MKSLFLYLFLLVVVQATGQVLWVEDFEAEANGATTGTAGGTVGGTWTTTYGGAGIFSKQNVIGFNVFQVNNTNGEGVWQSNNFSIATTGRATVDITIGGFLNGAGDYIRCYYKVDGGPEILYFEQLGGFISFTAVASAIVTGSTLQLVIRSSNDGSFFGLDTYTVDDVTVTAVRNIFSRKTGNWNDATPGNATWSIVALGGASCDCTPLATDYVTIGNSNTVSMTTASTAGGVEVQNTGVLRWTAGSIDLNIDRGILQVNVGGIINRNTQTGVQIDFDRSLVTSFINNGTITAEDIEIAVSDVTLNISGTGSIGLTDDFLITDDNIIVNNSLSGSFTITDRLEFGTAANNSTFNNNQILSVAFMYFNNDDCIITNAGTISGAITVNDSGDNGNIFTNSAGAVANITTIDLNNGNFTIPNSGTINQSGNFTNIDTGSNGSFVNQSTGTWNWTLTPNTTFDTDMTTVMVCTSVGNTFNYNATGAQRIIPISYHHLLLSASGAKDANNASFSVAGNWTVSGTATFTEGTGTITFNGTTAQTITNPSGETFNNLTINNTFGTSPQISFSNAITVSTVLTMTAGNVNLTGTTFILSSSAGGALVHGLASTNGWMYGGSFRRTFPTTAITVGTAAGFFPLGSSTDWRPFFIGKNSIAGSGGNMTVSHTNSTTTSIVSINDGGTTIVRRHDSFWTPSTTGIAAGTWNLRSGGTTFGIIGAATDLRMSTAAGVVGTHAAGTGGPTDWRVNRTGLTFGQLANNFHVSSSDAVNSPLPIELTAFSAHVEYNKVKIEWTTASELNNDYFTIERAREIEQFEDIEKIEGKGTTSLVSNYLTYDYTPFSGKSYYRLKQTDFDGQFSYSHIVFVEFEGTKERLTVYPNPVINNEVNILIDGLNPFEEVVLNMIDMRGVSTYSSKHTANHGGIINTTIDLTNSSRGLHIILVNSASGLKAKLLVE